MMSNLKLLFSFMSFSAITKRQSKILVQECLHLAISAEPDSFTQRCDCLRPLVIVDLLIGLISKRVDFMEHFFVLLKFMEPLHEPRKNAGPPCFQAPRQHRCGGRTAARTTAP